MRFGKPDDDRRRERTPSPKKPPRPGATRERVLILVLTLVLMLLLVSGFAGGRISADFSNLSDAYNDYGFGYCFLLSIVDRGVDKPDDYSREAVQDILDTIPPEPTAAQQGTQSPMSFSCSWNPSLT